MTGPLPCCMLTHRVAGVLLALTLFASGCGDDENTGANGTRAASPLPDQMCSAGQVPQAAAYDLDDGSFRWASCTDGDAFRMVQAATDDAVYVLDTSQRMSDDFPYYRTVALDPEDGSVLMDAPEAPAPEVTAEPGHMFRIPVDGLTVTGGQDDSVTVYNTDGTVRWNQPGTWVYDDVWAIDDGVVFAIRYGEPATADIVFPARLIAYELDTGEIRWDHLGDATREGLDPWLAENGRVFTVGQNLEVRDTGTGEVLWKTAYPRSQHPNLRLIGVAVNDDTVYAGFATAFGEGD
jgi:outer membrane protein assembly factor BamB